MKKKHVKKNIRELVKTSFLSIRKITPDLSALTADVLYSGPVFTVAVAILAMPVEENNSSTIIMGEGIAKLSSKIQPLKNGTFAKEKYDEITGYNIAMTNAIEAIDKKLRRENQVINHPYEG